MEWQQGNLVKLEITGLGSNGEGVGRYENRVVFVPDAVTDDKLEVRLITVKNNYAVGKVERLLEESPHRIKPPCIVAEKCGGCQWLHVSESQQHLEKEEQVRQALKKIGGFENPPVEEILASPNPLGYRNKASYPFQVSPDGRMKAGYYRKGTHKIVNLNQCPVQDDRLNPLLAGIKRDIADQMWPIYNEKKHSGEVRHLSLRIGRSSGEILITLITRTGNLPGLQEQAQLWMQHFPMVKGVCVNINPIKGNIISGDETKCIAGKPFINEKFAGLDYQLGSDTFFQVNTEVAESLLDIILDGFSLTGKEKVLDIYCGVGAFSLPLAKRSQKVLGIESQQAAVTQAGENAKLNNIKNAEFIAGNAEDILPSIDFMPGIVLLDPPRKGCAPKVLEALLDLAPQKIAYVSCNPSTLARDLKILCETGAYQLESVKPADFFPQTSHVECAAFLSRVKE